MQFQQTPRSLVSKTDDAFEQNYFNLKSVVKNTTSKYVADEKFARSPSSPSSSVMSSLSSPPPSSSMSSSSQARHTEDEKIN